MATLKDYLISGKFTGDISVNGFNMSLKDMLISAKLSGGGTPPEPTPLYPLPDMPATSKSGFTASFTAPTTVWAKTTSNSRRITFTGRGLIDTGAYDVPWFDVKEGDVCTFKIKNIVHNAPSGYNENFFGISIVNSSVAEIAKIPDAYITGGEKMADIESSVTIASTTSIYALKLYVYRPSEISFDVEIYINGERYL